MNWFNLSNREQAFYISHIKACNENISSDFHTQSTPFKLCVEMIEKVGTEINEQKDWLIIANLEFVIVLKEYFKYRNWDFDTVSFATPCKTKAKVAQALGIKNIVKYSYKNFKELEVSKKFDVIIGNPPYDGAGAKNIKLWAKFSNKLLSFNPNYLALVTPNNIISEFGINGEQLRNNINKLGYIFIYAENHGERYFKNVGVATCHWIITNRGSDKSIDPIIIKNEQEKNPLIDDIIDKVLNSTTKLELINTNGVILKSDLLHDGSGKNKIYFSGNKLKTTNKDFQYEGGLKVIFPFSSSYHKMFISEIGTGMLNAFFEISSKKEGEVIISYANSKLFKFIANNYKKTAGFTPLIKAKMLPDLRREEPWTNEELYKYFSLSQEQIDLIETSIKSI
jgi:hypothetical protein